MKMPLTVQCVHPFARSDLVKTAIAAMAACLMLIMVPAANAAPVKLSGEVSIRYETDAAADGPTESGLIYTFTLKGRKEIGKNLSLYGRLGAQYAGNPDLGDTDLPGYDKSVRSAAAIDQFGLVYEANKFTYILGRQNIAVGVTALLYSRPETNIGANAFVDGLSVAGTAGSFDVSAIAARENNIGLDNNSFYALRAGYRLSKCTTIGITQARYQYYNAGASNHWAMDGTITWGKSSLTAEYTQSNSNAENIAHAIVWNYKFNAKTAMYVTNFRVGAHGDMGGQSDYDNNNRGFHYGIIHSFDDKLSLELIFKDQVALVGDIKNTKFEATLRNTF